MERIHKLKAFIAEYPTDLFSRHALAMELLKIGETQDAIKVMEELLERDEQYTGTYLHLGRTYEQLNQTKEALAVYQKGIEICQLVRAQHDLNELMAAYRQLEEELEG